LPLQNRVTPFGELIAVEHRGTLMGNRGCLHDEHRRVRRKSVGKRWIVCLLEFKGRRRTVMAPGRYTELFFLDEATALAAGHRPCAECQRARYRLFREAWAAANPGLAPQGMPSAEEIDAALHAERRHAGAGGGKRIYTERLSRLPPGVMIAGKDGQAYLVLERVLLPWGPGGYGLAVPRLKDAEVRVLTPWSVVKAIAHGYPVDIHPSARHE
jgi:hypothetical protein